MSLDETLAAIDTAVGCQWCGGPLSGSVSDDFCCEDHQVAWHHAQAVPLPDVTQVLDAFPLWMAEALLRPRYQYWFVRQPFRNGAAQAHASRLMYHYGPARLVDSHHHHVHQPYRD